MFKSMHDVFFFALVVTFWMYIMQEQKPDIQQLEKPIENETPQERIKRLTSFDIGQCPACKKGRMHIAREIPRIRSPAGHLPTILLSQLK